jgi:hypothetical protein
VADRPDSAVGSPEFLRLPFPERLRIAEEAVGIFRGESDAFTLAAKPYGEVIPNPIDTWRF